MKKVMLTALLLAFLAPFAFSQTEEEIKEQMKIEMEQLQKDMQALQKDLKQTFADLKVELEHMEIDLSGLDKLKEMDWEEYSDSEEAKAYFNSGEFKKEMEKMKAEINKAMQEARREMEDIDWEAIKRSIDKAMREVEVELSKERKKQ